MESVAVPPASSLKDYCVHIGESKGFYMLFEEYPCGMLTIENADGSPVAIKDFVVQTHHHLIEDKDMLIDSRKRTT
jgi:hypothetical protein